MPTWGDRAFRPAGTHAGVAAAPRPLPGVQLSFPLPYHPSPSLDKESLALVWCKTQRKLEFQAWTVCSMEGLRLIFKSVQLSGCHLGEVYSMTPHEQGPCPSPTPQEPLCFGGPSSECAKVPSPCSSSLGHSMHGVNQMTWGGPGLPSMVSSWAAGLSPVPGGQSEITPASWHSTFFAGSWERLGSQNGAKTLIVGDSNCIEDRGT